MFYFNIILYNNLTNKTLYNILHNTLRNIVVELEMSRTGINYQDVANAAAMLLGANQNPTVDGVREILGTGSKSTIARHLKDWKNNNDNNAVANGLPAELVELVTGLWQRLESMADKKIQEYNDQADERLLSLDTELGQIINQYSDLQDKHQNLEEEFAKINDTSTTLQQDLTSERQVTARLNLQVNNLEEKLVLQNEENSRLHQLLKNMQSNLEHYQDSVQKLQFEQSLVLDKQRVNFEHTINDLRQQLLVSSNQEYNLKLRNQELEQQLSELELIKMQQHELEKGLNDRVVQVAVLEEKYNQIVNANTQLMREYDIKNKDFSDASKNITIAHARISEMEKLLQKAEDEIARARQEQTSILQAKAHLEGQIKQLVIKTLEKN